jgi:hypothetical protein
MPVAHALKKVFEVGVGVDLVELGGCDGRSDDRPSIGAVVLSAAVLASIAVTLKSNRAACCDLARVNKLLSKHGLMSQINGFPSTSYFQI